MKLEEGTRCWIPDSQSGWLGVNVTKVEYDDSTGKYRIELINDDNNGNENKNNMIVIETSDMAETNQKLPQLRNMDDTVDDLTTLSHLNEPSVLNSVKLRYSLKKIYTFSGVVLIAVNPFDRVDNLYTNDVIKKYQNAIKSDNPPHVFAIADDAYKLMKQSGKSQSIIVSGESGAGKTVSAKYIMRFFASVHTEGTTIDTTEIEKQILATNPIMESFGNAKTIRNDNSSRFGKYLKLSFDENFIICGANIQTYLLERSRLVYQAKNERNYHIFYQMIKGLPEKIKKQLSLQNCENYNYLFQGGVSTVNGVDDSKDFRDTCQALKIIGLDEDKQFELFKILSGLLHIGNIKIENSRNQAILEIDDPNLLIACELLGLDSNEFAKWITKKKISTRSDNIASSMQYHEAIVARDSVSKYIYSTLFDWLVFYINSDLSPSEIESKTKFFIGVLDIYGFEHFEENSFEQFCINYANEKLQQEFTLNVFKMQQEDYINEGIEWSFIKFSDNQPCIDVIENRGGILSLLDEQCKLPSGSDKAWAEKMFHSLTKPPHDKVFKKARFGNEKFIVSHYALDVSYEVEGFIEKNRDSVSDAQDGVLKASTNKFMQNILSSFDKSKEETKLENRRSFTNRNKKPTVGYLFKNSLNELMKIINSTNAHYIRCIKPNETKTPWNFENLMVLSQLRACGVLETIRISLVGFPSKYTYEEFLRRFVILLPLEDELNFKKGNVKSYDDMKKLSTKLLRGLISDYSLFQAGKTKLFFRAGILGHLEIAKTNKIKHAVIIIQKNLRCYAMRALWTDARESIVSLQSTIRGNLARSRIVTIQNAAIRIQSLLRGFNERKRVNAIKLSIISIQSIARGAIERKEYMLLKKRIIEERKLKQLKEEEEEKERERIELEKEENLKKEQELQLMKEMEARKQKEEELKSKDAEKLEQLEFQGTSDENNISGRDSNSSDATVSSHNAIYNSVQNEKECGYIDDIASALEKSCPPLNYSYDDLLGMKPHKSLSIITRFIVLRIKNISEHIENIRDYEQLLPDVRLVSKLQKGFEDNIIMLKKTMKRVKYTKPDIPTKRMSNISINTTSTQKAIFGQSRLSASDLDRSFKSGYADLKDYMTGSYVPSTLVAKLLLHDIKPPPENSDGPAPVEDVLFPARVVVSILNDMLQLGMVNQSVYFVEKVISIFKDDLLNLNDPEMTISRGAYLLNNVNEIRSCITSSRYSAMSDFGSTVFVKSEERQEYLKMLLIMKRYCETVFGQMYNIWMKSILHELDKKAIDSVVLDDTLYLAKDSHNTYFRQLFNKGPKYKMFDVLRLFNNVYIAMKTYCFEEIIATSVIHDMLVYIDILCFNDIMTRKSYLNVNKGLLLKYNISILIDWCNEHGIPDSPNKLIHILTLCQILQLKKQGLADIDMILKFCDSVNKKQVERILSECDSNRAINEEDDKSDTISKPRTSKATHDTEEEPFEISDYTIPYAEDRFENAFFNYF